MPMYKPQAVNVEGNFLFDKAGHRDFLGAVLGAGIAREKVRTYVFWA